MVTEWTVFSPCSVSCGEGVRKRTRNYINEKRAKEASCNTKLIEKTECGAKCINNVSCETTSWSEWSPCHSNATICGKGHRQRTRKFMHRMARKVCANVELVQKESCFSAEHRCNHSAGLELNHTHTNTHTNGAREGCAGADTSCADGSPPTNEAIEPKCAVTRWSEWSPCTQSCGKGFKLRTRLYINPYKSKNLCDVPMVQSMDCVGESCPADRNDAKSKSSALGPVSTTH